MRNQRVDGAVYSADGRLFITGRRPALDSGHLIAALAGLAAGKACRPLSSSSNPALKNCMHARSAVDGGGLQPLACKHCGIGAEHYNYSIVQYGRPPLEMIS